MKSVWVSNYVVVDVVTQCHVNVDVVLYVVTYYSLMGIGMVHVRSIVVSVFFLGHVIQIASTCSWFSESDTLRLSRLLSTRCKQMVSSSGKYFQIDI